MKAKTILKWTMMSGLFFTLALPSTVSFAEEPNHEDTAAPAQKQPGNRQNQENGDKPFQGYTELGAVLTAQKASLKLKLTGVGSDAASDEAREITLELAELNKLKNWNELFKSYHEQMNQASNQACQDDSSKAFKKVLEQGMKSLGTDLSKGSVNEGYVEEWAGILVHHLNQRQVLSSGEEKTKIKAQDKTLKEKILATADLFGVTSAQVELVASAYTSAEDKLPLEKFLGLSDADHQALIAMNGDAKDLCVFEEKKQEATSTPDLAREDQEPSQKESEKDETTLAKEEAAKKAQQEKDARAAKQAEEEFDSQSSARAEEINDGLATTENRQGKNWIKDEFANLTGDYQETMGLMRKQVEEALSRRQNGLPSDYVQGQQTPLERLYGQMAGKLNPYDNQQNLLDKELEQERLLEKQKFDAEIAKAFANRPPNQGDKAITKTAAPPPQIPPMNFGGGGYGGQPRPPIGAQVGVQSYQGPCPPGAPGYPGCIGGGFQPPIGGPPFGGPIGGPPFGGPIGGPLLPPPGLPLLPGGFGPIAGPVGGPIGGNVAPVNNAQFGGTNVPGILNQLGTMDQNSINAILNNPNAYVGSNVNGVFGNIQNSALTNTGFGNIGTNGAITNTGLAGALQNFQPGQYGRSNTGVTTSSVPSSGSIARGQPRQLPSVIRGGLNR